MKLVILITLIILITKAYNIYQTFQESPETEFKWDGLNGKPPEELITKTNMMNESTSLVWVILFEFLLFEIFAYLEKPKEHFVTKYFIPLFKSIEESSKKEDDEDE